jgi:3-dehydroquinate synthase
METLHVELGARSYRIAVASHEVGLGEFARICAPRSTAALIVADENTDAIAEKVSISCKAAGFHPNTVVVQAGESTKSLEWAGELYDELAELKADRRMLVIAVGGGVIGDLAGFAAATYNRGLPLFMVPTTLLSMVDSSVGGKVGINHPQGKNLIGSFHQPAGVFINTAFLDSLPEREYLSGLAEVVKYGVILDAGFFEYIEANVEAILARNPTVVRHIVQRSCRLKADVVEKDEREETGLRAVLNYGHTFAHAFEAVAGYGTWLHGEAVSAGMVYASRLAEALGRVDAAFTARQRALLQAFRLPVGIPTEWPADELIAAMYRDKKTEAGKLRFVLPTRMGHVEIVDGVPETLVRRLLAN